MLRNDDPTVFGAPAHPSYRRIQLFLCGRRHARAGDLARALKIGQFTRSGHLKDMRQAALVSSRRSGTEHQYRTNSSTLDRTTTTSYTLHDPTTQNDEVLLYKCECQDKEVLTP